MRKLYISILTLATSFAAFAESPVHSKVIDFVPAPGQFVNELPEYEEGDDATKMAEKAYSYTASDGSFVSLGAWGGYITVGFSRTIVNVDGKRDIYIEGNAFQAGASTTQGGSSEPGVVLVAYDINKNGVPDDGEWFEIAGSEYKNSVRGYEVTYKRPSQLDKAENVEWTDNKGNSGYVYANAIHTQSYWPSWLKDKETLTFKGIRLPDNGKNEGTDEKPYFVLSRFEYGYADNYPNVTAEDVNVKEEGAFIDIDWAVDENGNAVKMPGVDFVRIYTGVNQTNGILGECSTDVARVMNGHTTGIGKDEAVDESVVINEKVLADFLAKYSDNGGVDEFSNYNVRIYIDQNGTVRFSLNRIASAAVYDQWGRRVYSALCQAGENTIDLSGYPSGLYIVKADTATEKILKK